MATEGTKCFYCGRQTKQPRYFKLVRGKRSAGYKPFCPGCVDVKHIVVEKGEEVTYDESD